MSYVPWVWNCSSACVPRSWISSAALSPAPPKCTYCVAESGASHTWHSELAQCWGQLPLVSWPRYMWRGPVRQAPVKERRFMSLLKEWSLQILKTSSANNILQECDLSRDTFVQIYHLIKCEGFNKIIHFIFINTVTKPGNFHTWLMYEMHWGILSSVQKALITL